jgi:hypothetical protein
MNVCKSLREIDDSLPNGFHDALLNGMMIDFASNRAELDLRLCVGDPDAATEDEREAYRSAKLFLYGLVYFVIDAPAFGHTHSETKELRIDGGEATEDSSAQKPRGNLPADAFAYWFFVQEWNSFIHVAARGVNLQWM